MGVIFDLDQTLIDSELAIDLRSQRKWSDVYKLIPRLTPYDGINQLIEKLSENNIPVCIVTTSPSSYCLRIINYWGWKNIKTVCYHDTNYRKPHPEPILKGIERLGVSRERIVSIGDDPKDIIASKRAGVKSIAALWGSKNKKEILESQPDYIVTTVGELDDLLTLIYKL